MTHNPYSNKGVTVVFISKLVHGSGLDVLSRRGALTEQFKYGLCAMDQKNIPRATLVQDSTRGSDYKHTNIDSDKEEAVELCLHPRLRMRVHVFLPRKHCWGANSHSKEDKEAWRSERPLKQESCTKYASSRLSPDFKL